MKFTPGNAKQIPELLKDMLALQREARHASARPKKQLRRFWGILLPNLAQEFYQVWLLQFSSSSIDIFFPDCTENNDWEL